MDSVQHKGSSSSTNATHDEPDDEILRKKARNKEYVKKSIERKKAYVQRLEDENKNMSNLIANANLIHKQDLIPANKTIIFPQSTEPDALKFGDLYKSWFNAHNDLISGLRAAMLSNETDTALSPMIKTVFDHLKSLSFLKKLASNDDVLNIVYGTWMTPAELCLMWLGGFRPSDIVNLLIVQLQLTPEQKKFFINLKSYTLQQESHLSRRVTDFQSSLSKIFVGQSFVQTGDESYYKNYMSQMHFSIGKLHLMEEIMHQSDRLRSDTLDKIYNRLITKQFAMSLLALNDYLNRIAALSVLWISRPK